MIYRQNPKNGDNLSQLGFGCMRFPHKGVGIDISRSADIVHSAIEQGVNYFDTAYIYPGSENALGQILSGGWRDKVNIATKMPMVLVRSAKDFDKFFAQELEHLKTDRIDYYMLHMLTDKEHFNKFKLMGIENWLKNAKADGRIKNIGFSFHGKYNTFVEMLDSYDWDFCMIQYNYLDENHQAGTAGLKYASSKNLPVIVMEPLRGGILASKLPKTAVQAFQAVNPERTPADWGLRWIWNHPEATVVLSGMSDETQVAQNIKTACEATENSMSEEELNAIIKVVEIMKASIKINCTGCGYCMPCPEGVDIPGAFDSYGNKNILKRSHIITNHIRGAGMLSGNPGFASQCVRCGKCEQLCPQGIKIMDNLKEASKYLEPFWVRGALKVARTFTGANIKNRKNRKKSDKK